MTRYVIGPDVAMRLAQMEAKVPAQHRLLAPTLLRSQVLAQLYGLVRRGELDRKAAERQRRVAWKIAEQLGWLDTFVAEYVALTQLQGDAFVCMDPELLREVSGIVVVASIDDLIDGSA